MKGAVEKFCAVAERINPLIWALAVVLGVAGVIWVVKKQLSPAEPKETRQA